MNSVMFGWLDYLIFALSLGIPVLIGIYFGFFKKQNSTKQYLYGVGQMTAIPVGMSLYSSATSSILLLGVPVEMYVFGGQFALVPVGYLLSLIITWMCILPVFCGSLSVASPYEYIELRFNYTVRLLSTCIYVLHTLLYMPIALFASTLTFSEATGISLEICIAVVGGLCVFYTTVGGFSSVIWTDTLQGVLMFGAAIFVLCTGVSQAGGITEVWQRSKEGQRLDVFNMDLNPFTRMSTVSVIIGMCIFQVGHSGCTASSLQRYMALATEKQARIGSLICIVGAGIAFFIACMIGWCMYAFFYQCDPVLSNKITDYNKMVPYYIAQICNNVPGFFGFFTAGLLSAGLSTISAEMNTVGGLIYHDIIERIYKKPISTAHGAFIIKIIVFCNGLFYLIAAPYFQKSKYLSTLAIQVAGITYGVKVGVMLLGTTVPKCNVKGVICGMIAGMFVVSWISIGAMFYNSHVPYKLPMSTENCTSATNNTLLYNSTAYIQDTTTFTSVHTDKPPIIEETFSVYKLSFTYYPVLGLLITMLVAMVVSYLTGFHDINKMDPRLIIPRLRPVKEQPVGLPNRIVQ